MTSAPAFRRAPRPDAALPAGTSATSRLNKRMAELGLCSRREADAWIEQGWVRVNGEVASMGQQVGPNDRITVDKAAEHQQQQQLIQLEYGGLRILDMEGLRRSMFGQSGDNR